MLIGESKTLATEHLTQHLDLFLVWYAMTACWWRLIQPASINISNCPGEHHDFDFMGTILPWMPIENGATEWPQNADILVKYSTFEFRYITAADALLAVASLSGTSTPCT